MFTKLYIWEELLAQEVDNIYDSFAVAIRENSNIIVHVPWKIQKSTSGSEII